MESTPSKRGPVFDEAGLANAILRKKDKKKKLGVQEFKELELRHALLKTVSDNARSKSCLICNRKPMKTTKHHLVPKQTESFGISWYGKVVRLCISCHVFIHATWDNKTLALEFNTEEKILTNPKIIAFGNHVRNLPTFETYSKSELRLIMEEK